MVTLKNNVISIEISTTGAEMKKIIVNGKERLWNGDPSFWSGTAPVMFPICGGLPEDKFTYNGREYTLPKHGFAKTMNFEVENQTGLSATFLLKSNEETLKMYPWSFEFRITYSLEGARIKIDYDIKNTSEETMYASVGAHEAHACPEGIEDYDVIFEKKETLNTCGLSGNLISDELIPIIKETDTLPLYYHYFDVDALIFKDLKSRSATLRNRKTGESVNLSFDGFDYFLLWTVPKAGYICLEPWTGIPPMLGSDNDITKKEGITALEKGATFHRTHLLYYDLCDKDNELQ